jgi:AraC-like DNA-binding protein
VVREDALAARVRAWIRAHLRHADLALCARTFGMSTRTIQRRLGVAGKSFREIVAAERVAAARSMLVRAGTSIDAVAYAVGCSSSSQLGVLLRRAGYPSPSALRADSARSGSSTEESSHRLH